MVPLSHTNNMNVVTQTDNGKEIYRYCCTIKPTQTCPLRHTAEGGHLHILIPKTTKQPELPAQRHPTPADEQAVECPHVHGWGRFPIQARGPAAPCSGRNRVSILSYCSGLGSGMGKHCLGSHYTVEAVRLSWA